MKRYLLNPGLQMSVLAEKFIKFSQFLDDVKFGYAFNSHEWSVLLVVMNSVTLV